MDGARLFNAASSLNCELRDFTTAVGVDILSLGGTKVKRRWISNVKKESSKIFQVGLMFGEAVVVFNPSLMTSGETENVLKYRHKQVMQLASKQRFISVQFLTLLKNDLWKRSSEHSNAMAQLLKKRLESLPKPSSIRLTRPVQTNAIFLEIPHHWYEPLSSAFPFYQWRTKNCEVRLMCSFDTTEEDIDRFIAKVHELLE